MATRRSRIKGIANIPQRRKVENLSGTDANLNHIETNISTVSSVIKNEPVINNSESSINANSIKLNRIDENPRSEQIVIPEIIKRADLGNDNKIKSHLVNIPQETPSEVVATPGTIDNPQIKTELPRRRTFLKPSINVKLLQKSKSNTEVKCEVNSPETASESKKVVCSLDTPNEHLVSPLQAPVEFVSNVQSEDTKAAVEVECSVAPLSPTKLINRSRIKAVPRLGQRRNSVTVHGSASESEDDGKKHFKRIRTESACSTISTTTDSQVYIDKATVQKSKEFSSIIQRKCKRTEQSRKMAEARRHFLHKFGNTTPDKQKLTMIDLIFYNPVTKPMSQRKKVQIKEIDEDDPEEPKLVEEPHCESIADSKGDDEDENGVPAPQIKIGANGEIVIDEKSLVIENVETIRGREELEKSKLVDGDFDSGYGIYKREKRSKDWSKADTLRFYKALNTLGTDFTMMVELFAGRSRRELKMKFKKEERVNRALVDKALTQPMQFDITELRREAELQKELEEMQAQKQKDKLDAITKQIPYRIQKPKSTARRQTKKKRPKYNDMYSKLEKGIDSLWESDIESEEETDENADEPPEFSTELIPTRCGRIPKRRTPYTAPEFSVKKHTKREPCSSENNVQSHPAIKPGSIMIITSRTPTGEPTYEVFMVTETRDRIPITLTQDMLHNLTQGGEMDPLKITENDIQNQEDV